MMGYYFRNGLGCGLAGGGWLGTLLICLAIAGVVLYLVLRQPKQSDKSARSDANESINVLNLRFARGEISEEEYKARKAAILK